MNYRSFIDKLISYSSKNSIVQYACEGDIYEILNSKENRYGTVVWATENLSLEEGNMTVTGNLIYADRLLNDSSNKIDVQSAGITALQSIITEFVNDSDDMSVEYISMTPYTEKFADLCAGAYVNVSFTFLTDVSCLDDTEWTPRTISITKNGTYDVTGYDKADVSVLPTHTDIKITENGTYLPNDYGVDAFDKVEVDAVFGNVKMAQPEKLFNFFSESMPIEQVDFNDWDVSFYKEAANIFIRNRALREIRVDRWDTSNFTTIQGIFRHCTNLRKIDVSNWDVSNVTDMSYAFEWTEHLESLDLSKWNVPKVTTTRTAFDGHRSMISYIGTDVRPNNLIDYDVKCLNGLMVSTIFNTAIKLRYTSMLAVMKGLADITGTETPQTITFNAAAWNNVRNDDDTIPSADIIAERQAYLSSIAAEKGWTLTH